LRLCFVGLNSNTGKLLMTYDGAAVVTVEVV
jgi:hypothetical protein